MPLSLRRACRRPGTVTTARTTLAISRPTSRKRREVRWSLIRGGGRQSYGQAYGQPYSQQYPYPSPSYGPYPPYGQDVYWGVPYDPRRHEANALGGWALGLGITSIFANCLSLGLILGISAIVVGVLGMRAANEGRASNKGLSIAGVVTGGIGAFIGAAYLILFIVMLSQ